MDTSKGVGTWQMFVAELSVGSAPVPIWAGVDMDVNGTSQINVGLLVEAGDGGGGAPVPSGCSRTSLVFFLMPRRCGGSSNVVFLFAGWVIGLGLWVQIGTADGRKCFAVDAALSTVGVVLGGGCKSLDTRRTPFPLLVADGLQWKGERDQTDCAGGKLKGPRAGNILRLICQV
jgi:hypothetical protein